MSTPVRHYVGGDFDASGDPFPLVDPVRGRIVAEIPAASAALVDRAVNAARDALRGPWGAWSPADRSRVLHRIADGIERRFEEFVAAECADTGKPRELAATVDIPRAVANFRFYADLLAGRGEQSWHTASPDGRGALNYTVHKPLGVVAVISPWNLPLLLLTWKVAPALATGNTVVAKPSELTPSTACLLAEVTAEAGLPDGVFNLVHGEGGDAAGQWLTQHPGVDAIAFTGESGTGTTIMRAAAARLAPVSFELGGKNAGLVFADADLDEAVAGTLRSAFTHSGQVCLCTERLYVERRVFDEFAARVATEVRALDGYGPMISAAHRDKVLGYLAKAAVDGEILAGGGVPHFGDERDQGFFVEPTVLAGLPEDHPAVREEIFGPVVHLAPFDTEEEALALANAGPYGLAATVWTRDLARAHRVAPALEVGIAWVNTWNLRDLRTPFGGVKASGIGREGGDHSLDFFSEPMNVCVKL
ncbi:2-hydroxymuconic semialdehyde dehydrogenase [Streptomyces sp. VRA16 Mangrove soil]|uniref:2-hydroxymuconic semialdehyde dehydrogenase n=1 Tax=Streptomyces sp. VRA16 Mangrove soil TaxID=2817434 RepID=UPI001A9F7463|nr:2-hydroxymuconic semialdehyde dehydrogenase [Streptomyces sp. VRA16 Mangrove soil]